MKRTIIAVVTAAAVLLAGGGMAKVAFGGQPNNSGNKVTICHATGSAKNPYVRITPDASGVISGHVAHQDKRDIIPPFDYFDSAGVKHHFAGQNWTAEGQAIFANGCKVPTTSTTPTGSTSTQTVTVTTPAPPPVTTTVNVPTTGPTSTTVTREKGKVVVKRKIHIKVAAKKAPKTTG